MTKTQREVMAKAFEKLAEAAQWGAAASLDPSTTPEMLAVYLDHITVDATAMNNALAESVGATAILDRVKKQSEFEGGAK